MSVLQAKRPKIKGPLESFSLGFNLAPWLIGDELVASVSSVAAESGLIASNGRINDAVLTDDEGGTAAVGQAIEYDVSGGSAGESYFVTVTVVTSSGRTLTPIQRVDVRDQ